VYVLVCAGDMDDLLNIIEQDWLPENRDDVSSTGDAKTPREAPSGPLLHPRWQTLSPGDAKARIATSGHCSALIKVGRGGQQ
jgi:hypothetical protein